MSRKTSRNYYLAVKKKCVCGGEEEKLSTKNKLRSKYFWQKKKTLEWLSIKYAIAMRAEGNETTKNDR